MDRVRDLVIEDQDRKKIAEILAQTGNPTGRLLVSMNAPAFNFLARHSFQGRAERELTRAFLALRIYQPVVKVVGPWSFYDTASRLAGNRMAPRSG